MERVNEKRVFVGRYESPIGDIHAVFTDAGLREIGIGDGFPERVRERYGDCVAEDGRRSGRLVRLLDLYFMGKRVEFDVPLDPVGTDFEKRVRGVLRAIPHGEVRSYGWVAKRAGCPRGARAVGGACARNPLPIVVPCHRVVASSGAIGGFSPRAGGVEMKKKLLELEGVKAFSRQVITSKDTRGRR